MGKAKSKKQGKKKRLHFRERQEAGGHFNETVGADLRTARTHRGLNVEDIASNLKIKPEFVRAIEESDFDALPGKTYAVGFVRAYADMMGARSEEYMRRFKAEMTGAEELKFNSITAKDKKKPLPLGQFVTAAVTVVLAVVVWQNAEEAIQAGSDVLEAFKPSPPETLVVEGEGGYSTSEISSEVLVGTTNRESEKLIAPPEISEGDAESEESASSSFELVEPVLTPRPLPSPLADGTHWGSENHDARVRFKALADTWLRVSAEDRVMFERVLKAGDSYSPPNSESTVLATRNAGDLEVYVDGRYVKPLGQKGQSFAGRVVDADKLLTGDL